MPTLSHREIHGDPSRVAVTLPLGEELAPLGGGAGFPLLEDPRKTDRALIIGMFVLRPAQDAWTTPLDDVPAALRAGRDWCFNVKGVDGGWLIAAGNPLDAYRLALQYGLSDAVIVGSNTVVTEGVDHDGHEGYLWQPYGPAAWPQLAALDAELAERIARLRLQWQAEGGLSSRRWPAQIVVTQSGKLRPGARDVFEARVFSATHPDGSPVESHVLTSEAGAERLRARAKDHGLADRIDEILLVASPPGDAETLDIPAVPRLLRERLDIRIANHDGGRTVLSEFSAAGVLPQMNLTLMRARSVREVLQAAEQVDETTKATLLAEFDARRQLFFSNDHALPTALEPVSVLSDDGEAIVVAFDARTVRGL